VQPYDQPLGAIAPDFMGLGYEIFVRGQAGLMTGAKRVTCSWCATVGRGRHPHCGTLRTTRTTPRRCPGFKRLWDVVNDAVLKDWAAFSSHRMELIRDWILGRAAGKEHREGRRAVIAGEETGLEMATSRISFLATSTVRRSTAMGWLADYAVQVGAAGQFPRVPLAGPDVAGTPIWVTSLLPPMKEGTPSLTHHYYVKGNRPKHYREVTGYRSEAYSAARQAARRLTECGRPYRIVR